MASGRLDRGTLISLAVNPARTQRTVADSPYWLVVLARIISDAALVFLGFYVAYWLRYSMHVGGEVLPWAHQPFSFFRSKAIMLVLLIVAIFHIRKIYRQPRWTTFLDEAISIANGVTTAMALVVLYSFLQRFYPSRLLFIYAWLLIIALLVGKRLLLRFARERLWMRGIGVDKVLIIGAGRAGERLMQWLLSQPRLGYQVVGFVDEVPPPDGWAIATDRRVVRPRYLGVESDVGALVREHGIDEVIIALPTTSQARIMTIVNQCRAAEVEFKLVPDLFELAMDRVNIHDVAGLPLIALKPAEIAGFNYAIKRAIDLLVSTLVLVVGAIPMALIVLAIRIDSPGPVLFRQVRVGRNGRHFICYKFRTMVRNAEQLQSELQKAHNVDSRLTKLKDDPRRTRVGKILRRTSLDELPQFFNVLKGEMSVVGPRPPVPAEVADYDEWHLGRLLVTPGLTGLWQVSGRSNLTFDEMVRLDLYYAENWSPWLDITIMLRTIPAILTARGAY